MTTYSINFSNKSANPWSLCIFQQQAGWASTAWIVKKVYRGTSIVVKWQLEYCFVWIETVNLNDILSYTASEMIPSLPGDINTARLNFNKSFYFTAGTNDTLTSGSMSIQQSETIPANSAMVGVGMALAPIQVVSAQPRVGLIYETVAQPVYWLAFGNYIAGEVLNPNEMTNLCSVSFPKNCYNLFVSIDAANTSYVTQ